MWKRWKNKLQIRRKYLQSMYIEFTENSQNQIVKNQTIPLENGQKTRATISLRKKHRWQMSTLLAITECKLKAQWKSLDAFQNS